MLEAIWFEVRQSVRSLCRSPGFVSVFIVTVGLALGALIATASVLEALVLRKVGGTEPHRLVSISTIDSRTNQSGYIYGATYAAYQETQRSFSKLSMYSTRLVRVEGPHVSIDGFAEGVTPDYFDVVSAKTSAGRLFTSADSAAAPVVVLSDRFRRRVFGDSSSVIGETIKVDSVSAEIIGVTSPGFAGLEFDGGTDLFLPIEVLQNLTGNPNPIVRSRYLIAQLAPQVTLEEARAEVDVRWSAIQGQTLPTALSLAERDALRSQRVDVRSIASGFSPLRLRYATSIGVLLGLSAVLLAIASVNLTGLLLARSLTQRHQIAVRLAVGAGRFRALSHTLLDSVLLTIGGFLLSMPVAWWTTSQLSNTLAYGRGTPLIQSVTPSASVLGFGALLALLLGLAVGILPAWRSVDRQNTAQLRSSRTTAGTLGMSGTLLLVAQVALSIVLLTSAGLFSMSLSKLQANYASIRANNIAFTRLARTPGDRRPIGPTYWSTLVEQLTAIPGVETAALSVMFPAYFESLGTLPTDQYSSVAPDSKTQDALTEFVSPGFFTTLDVPQLRGRDFRWSDDGTSLPVALVNRSLADMFFSGEEAVGRRLRVTSSRAATDLEIVGVVEDFPTGTLREPHQPTVFRPILQEPSRAQFPMAHVRFTGDLRSVQDGYVRTVASQGRHFVRIVFTLNEWADSSLLKERMMWWLSSFISLVTVMLACIGVFSMLAYTVSTRTRELGLRSALGAERTTIAGMIVREGLSVAIPGVAVGILTTLAVGGLIRSQLYAIEPHDPSTLFGAALAFISIIVIASLAPAIQAARIDPIEALRQD